VKVRAHPFHYVAHVRVGGAVKIFEGVERRPYAVRIDKDSRRGNERYDGKLGKFTASYHIIRCKDSKHDGAYYEHAVQIDPQNKKKGDGADETGFLAVQNQDQGRQEEKGKHPGPGRISQRRGRRAQGADKNGNLKGRAQLQTGEKNQKERSRDEGRFKQYYSGETGCLKNGVQNEL